MQGHSASRAERGAPTSTRERLLASATRLIWRHGYRAVSVDAICADAGANKGSFYFAYASKAEVLTRAIEQVWEHDRADLLALGGDSAANRFERHVDWFLGTQRALLAEHGFVPGHFHMAIDTTVAEAMAVARRNRDEYQAILRGDVAALLRERGAPEGEADFLTEAIGRMVAGVMSEARLANSLAPVEKLKPLVMRLVELVAGKALQ